MEDKNGHPYFLSGGGEMGELIRARDWSKTPLGNAEDWPQSLRTMVAVVLNNPFGMYIAWGKDYTQLYNDGYRPILGSSKHPQALGISTRETFSEIWHIIGSMFDGVMEGKAVGFPDFMLPLNRDGFVEECYFDFSYSPIKKEDGEVGGVLVTVVETTNKKKAETELKASEKRFRAIADNIPNLAWMAQEDGHIYWYNKKWYDYTGTVPAQMEGWGWQSVHNPKELPLVLEKWKSSIENGNPFEMVFPIKSGDGRYRQFLTRVSPVRNSEGKIEQWFGSNTDITDQKEAELALKESEERFRTMAEGTDILIAVGDENGKVMYFNKAWIELTGRTMEDLLKFGLFDLVHQGDKEKHVHTFLSAFEKKETFSGEFRVLNKKGNHRWLLVKGTPRFKPDGTFSGYISSCADITELKQADEALKESNKRFRNTVRQAPIGITILRGADYNVEMANDIYLQIVDRKEAEFVGRPLFDSLPEVEETVHPLLDEVLKTGVPFNANEYPIPVNRYGKHEVSYFSFVYHPLKEEDGNISGIIVTVTEVSESAKAKHFIAESEKKFRTIVMKSPIAMAIFRGEQNIIEMANSTMFENIWRRKEKDLLGKKLLDAFPELKEQKYPELLHEVFVSGKAYREVESLAYVQGDDGLQKFYLDLEYSPLFEPGGATSGIMVTVNDVTEKVEARIRIEESEQKFRLLANSMPQHVWISDSKGNLNYFNQSVYDYSGLTPDQIDKEGWISIVHPDDREENIRKWLKAVNTKEDFLFEHRFRRFDGEYRWQLSRAIPQKNSEGNIQMWVGTSTDIQEQKTFANNLEKLVQQRTIELKQKNEELENMNKELQSFAYISSHDLQEPLRKIQTFSSQIIDKEAKNLSENGLDKFKRMQNSAKRMQTLIEDLLSYSRTNTAERKFELVALSSIIEDVKQDLEEELQNKHAQIDATESCIVNIIPFQFRQLLYNLLSNSLKFSQQDKNPHIIIKGHMDIGANLNNEKLADAKRYCHISVSDNGIGFEPIYSKKIFEVFQRLHSKEQYSGTGIGLAIVKKIVENHDGIVTAKGELNKGATFDIYIPAD